MAASQAPSSPLILPDRVVGVGTARRSVRLDQRGDVEGHAAKLQAEAAILDRNDSILGPGVHLGRAVLLMIICQPNAAGVEEDRVAEPANLLQVRVAAGEIWLGV